MYEQITKNNFMDRFNSIRPKSFTYDGLSELYDILMEQEGETGIEMELDIIAIDSIYAEYDSVEEAAEEYGWDEDENYQSAEAYLKANNVQVYDLPKGGVIILSNN